MPINISEQPNFNPADTTDLQASFDWAMLVADDQNKESVSDRNLVIQLAIAVAHLTYKVSQLEDRLP